MVKIQHDSTIQIQTAIRTVIAERGRELVDAYYQGVRFAGSHFDSLGRNDPNSITSDDLLAVSLLDTPFSGSAILSLLGSPQLRELLERLGEEVALWEIEDLGHARQLSAAVQRVNGVGRTRTSKLLARKRPHLFPILDSVVCDALGLGNVDSWNALRRALSNDDLRVEIDGMWHGEEALRPSTLRLLDVATWMRYSASGNAREARRLLEFPD